jgi:hypothetical protein
VIVIDTALYRSSSRTVWTIVNDQNAVETVQLSESGDGAWCHGDLVQGWDDCTPLCH